MNKNKLKLELLDQLIEAVPKYPIIGCSEEVVENQDVLYRNKSYTLDIEGAIVTVSKTIQDNKTYYDISACLNEENSSPVSFSSEDLSSPLYQQLYNAIRKKYKNN